MDAEVTPHHRVIRCVGEPVERCSQLPAEMLLQLLVLVQEGAKIIR